MALIPRSVAHKRKRTASQLTIEVDETPSVASSVTLPQIGNKKPRLGVAPAPLDDLRDVNALADAVAWCFEGVRCGFQDGNERIQKAISERRFVLLQDILALLSFQWISIPSFPPGQIIRRLSERYSNELEIRIAVMDSRSDGGYEIRRMPTRERNEDRPDERVLLESIPTSQSSLAGIHRLLKDLLPGQGSCFQVSYITPYLPPSLLPAAESSHRLQNGCVVHLKSYDMKKKLLNSLPWVAPEVEIDRMEDDSGDVGRQLRKQGCRALDIVECERKMREYLEYQSKITDLLNPPNPPTYTQDAPHPKSQHVNGHVSTTTTSLPSASQYPKSCLLFAQNLPESTNKTALKALFNDVLMGEEEVDYVDWDKGKVHAFIRVATPAQAARISEAFPADAADGDKVRCEIVSGTREVIYWMALPEKIRMGAVHRERGSM